MTETPQFVESLKHGPKETGVEELILERWSPRAFADKQVASGDLKKIFTAASWAASSYNEQPWRFLIGKKGDATYQKILGSLMELNQKWAKSAPILIAAFAKKTFSHNGSPNPVAAHDVGAASATMSLQAIALGIHTHGMAGYNRDTLRAAFSVPEDFEPTAVWAMGYFGDPETLPEGFYEAEVSPRTRKAVNEFVFNEWDKTATL
jgi:nitroreductase